MRLMIFPASPGHRNGYEIAVRADLARLEPGPEDLVICYAGELPPGSAFQRMPRENHTPARKVLNLLRLHPAAEVGPTILRRMLSPATAAWDEVFCGEVIFYRALRRLFPAMHLHVRVHNFYSFANYRQSLRRFPLTWRMRYHLASFTRLEAEILSDKNVTPIFITDEELGFARLAFPGLEAECWPVVEAAALGRPAVKPPTQPRLVYFGSGSAQHSVIGLQLLCRVVLPQILAEIGHVELHLFGMGTERFSDASRHIFGHGAYHGEGLPLGGDAVFTVPDLLGCGIKLKVADLLRAGTPFISTPFGLSGYVVPASPHVMIGELDAWPRLIGHYFGQVLAASSPPLKNRGPLEEHLPRPVLRGEG
jgi:hypothetical protein